MIKQSECVSFREIKQENIIPNLCKTHVEIAHNSLSQSSTMVRLLLLGKIVCCIPFFDFKILHNSKKLFDKYLQTFYTFLFYWIYNALQCYASFCCTTS